MKTRHKRVALALGGLAAVGAITALVLNAFESNLVFFYSPTQVVAQEAPKQRTFRIGGLVEEGSVKRDGVQVNFVITDTAKAVPVRYQGILPDLFREGQGVVTEGKLQEDGSFVADTVLAKHDENYMPRELANSLKEKGVKLGKGAEEGAYP